MTSVCPASNGGKQTLGIPPVGVAWSIHGLQGEGLCLHYSGQACCIAETRGTKSRKNSFS